MRKSVLLAGFVLIPMSYLHAQIPTSERDALIALYNATNGSGWTDKTGWETATLDTECTWYGVTCSGNGHVSVLKLYHNNLAGTLPAELGDLTGLYSLYLAANPLLSGSIPSELGNTSLQHIKLYNNDLTGSIPPELGNLSNLLWLSLYNNRLTGSIPPELGNLSSLQYFISGGNQLSGSIPPELGNLTGLWGLKLGFNQLSGSIPPELGNLTSLFSMELQFNKLSGTIPPALGALSSLTRLEMHINRLSGTIPPELGGMTVLEELNLDRNRLTGSIPPELGGLSSLERLSLFSNQLSGDIPVELEDLTNLSDFNISWNAVHSDDASLIAFLESKQSSWQYTQTIAPENLILVSTGNHTVWLSWDAVSYQEPGGGYEVFSSPTGTGIWTAGGWTESKATVTFPVTGLDPGTTYDLAVISYTDPHGNNLNLVSSDLSAEVMTTTSGTGCTQPVIDITGAGAGPFTLSLTESYDSYTWSTAETTSSIVAGPPYGGWYWVTVTSAGPCTETASILVDPDIFTDEFEFGDVAEWSSSVP